MIYLTHSQVDELAVACLRAGRNACARSAKKELCRPGLRVHDPRHTAASLGIASGANVKAVQSMLGHASAAMTLDVYAGLFTDDMDAVAELLDAAVSQARADSLRTAEVLRLAQGTEKGFTGLLACANA